MLTYKSWSNVPAAERAALHQDVPALPCFCLAHDALENSGVPQEVNKKATPVSRRLSLVPSAALRLELQELRDRIAQGLDASSELLPRIDAVLASWAGVPNKDIKARFQINHDTLWRTKRQLADGGVNGFLNAQKRALRAG